MSPSKLRRVVDPIRGQTYGDAIEILETLPYRGTKPIRTELQSLVSNLTSRTGVRSQNLFLKEIQVHHGPTLKRFQPRAKGRGFEISKPMCWVRIRIEAV